MYSTNHSFVNIYLLNEMILLGFLFMKVQSHLAVFKVYYKPRMCVLSKKKKLFVVVVQLRSLPAAAYDVTIKMWRKYTIKIVTSGAVSA